MNWRIVASVFFVLFPLAVSAQTLPPKKKPEGELRLKLVEQSGGKYFVLEGKLPYPSGVVLSVELKFENSGETLKWYATSLDKKQSFSLRMGPFRKTLLPGVYTAVLWFKMANQPPQIRAFLQTKYNYSLRYTRIIDGAYCVYGTKEEIVESQKRILRQYLKFLQEIEELYQEVNKTFGWEKERRNPKKTPSLKQWKAYQKELLRKIRHQYKNMKRWRKQFVSVEKGLWVNFFGKVNKQVYRLSMLYARLLQATKKQPERVASLESQCKAMRQHIENSISRYRIKIQHLLEPGKKPEGEEGVE